MKNKLIFMLCAVLAISVVVFTAVYADNISLINDTMTVQRNTGDYYQSVVDCSDSGSVSFSVNGFTPTVTQAGYAAYVYNFNDAGTDFLRNGGYRISTEIEVCMIGITNGLEVFGDIGFKVTDTGGETHILPLVRTIEDDTTAHTYSVMINTCEEISSPVWTTVKTGLSNTQYTIPKIVYVNGTLVYYIDGVYIASSTVQSLNFISGLRLEACSTSDYPSKPRFRNLKITAEDISLFKILTVTDSEGNPLKDIGLDESIMIGFSNEITADSFFEAISVDGNTVGEGRLSVTNNMKTLVIAAPTSGWDPKQGIVLSIDSSAVIDIYGLELQEAKPVVFGASGPMVYITPYDEGFVEVESDDGDYMTIGFNTRNLSDSYITVSVILLECSGEENKCYVVASSVTDVILSPQTTNVPINAAVKITSETDNVFYKALIWNKYSFDTVLTEPIVLYIND